MMTYTQEQQAIIHKRTGELLVSAAAGSGKTAVLVQRLIALLTEGEAPITVNDLLVVTFTKAAAAEMKARVGVAIEKTLNQLLLQETYLEASKRTLADHLTQQLLLLPAAKITTIHSFCLSVIRDYFDVLQMDPNFRVADTTEIQLIKKDVMDEVLEEAYKRADSDFLFLVSCFAPGKTDVRLEQMILDLLTFAYSTPFPKDWLKYHCFNPMDVARLKQDVIHELKSLKARIGALLGELEQLLNLADAPLIYEPVLKAYQEWVGALRFDDFEQTYQTMQQAPKVQLSTKRKGMDPVLRETGKQIITQIRSTLDMASKDILSGDYSSFQAECQEMLPAYASLQGLVDRFVTRFSEVKREKGIIDFTDIEHMALQLLLEYDETTHTHQPSAIAHKYTYQAVMIDEYQDSNMVQELILRAVSSEKSGQPNLFMVGDVKQSIYKFRMARPELFMEKYQRYETKGAYQKMHMTMNFRSRPSVIDSVNHVFEHLMSSDFGGVAYDQFARLHAGMPYESQVSDDSSELLIVAKEVGISNATIEAEGMVKRIQRLLAEPFMVYDHHDESIRPIRYKDIAILHRAPKGICDDVLDVFRAYNIPVHTDFSTGYLDTFEVATMLNLLKVIDNHEQDIPLVSVLRSPIVGLDDEALATLRIGLKGGSFYQCMLHYIRVMPQLDPLKVQLEAFIKNLGHYRMLSKVLSIDQLMARIIKETQYDLYIRVMPGGYKRLKNLELLQNRSVAYSKTSYQGIFHFLRYMDYLKKYDIELGEASVLSEHDDVIRLISIHKSKGLEFPVVFLMGMEKPFNLMDLKQPIMMHQDYGIALDYVNPVRRYRLDGFKKALLKYKIKKEMLEEELRILYVAMTRAREKLIIMGCEKDLEKATNKWSEATYGAFDLQHMNCYQDWLMALLTSDCGPFKIELPHTFDCDLIEKEPPEIISVAIDHADLEGFKDQFDFSYPDQALTTTKSIISVSDLKQQKWDILSDLPNTGKPVGLSGTQKGNLYHIIWYHLDFAMDRHDQAIDRFLDRMVKDKILSQKQRELVHREAFLRFLNQPLVQKLCDSGQMTKEVPFVLGVSAKEGEPLKEDGFMMIQGVVDCLWVDGNEAIILDYKTDYVPENGGHMLIERYAEQLELYRKAVMQVLPITTIHCYIYSMTLDLMIEVT